MQHLQHISELAPVLKKMGATQVIIAPGSRNAPLIQLFTSHGHFQCHSIVDERSAAYVALGMARQSGEPVVLVTTSGTAVLNLSPAVAEAFHQQLPLVVLTADRPREKVSLFTNQVIDQRAPYFNHSKGYFDFPVEVRSTVELQHHLSSVEQLLEEAMRVPRGPVHVNLPLAEPLYVKLPGPVLSLREDQNREDVAESGGDHSLPESIGPDRKVLILAGMGQGTREVQEALEQVADRGQVAVVAENISNLHSESFVSVPELVLGLADPDELGELAPDVVVTFGLQMVSKQMRLFVHALDKADILELPQEAPVGEWLKFLAGKWEKPAENHYGRIWLEWQQRACRLASAFLEKAPFCNLVAVQSILKRVPAGTVVHLGNSATIRNSQLIPSRSGLKYCSNRGTSGIDGTVSTAVGAAMVSSTPQLLLVGDLSFVYDSNALWNKNFPENLKIVVVNDGGGGIFRLLDGPSEMDFFEEYSVTHHPVSLELLSQSFGRSFLRISGKDGLIESLETLFSHGAHLSVLEVDTTSAENSRIFKELFAIKHD